MTTVRAHSRRGTRGISPTGKLSVRRGTRVRRHYRQLRNEPSITLTLNRQFPLTREEEKIIAFTHPRYPYVIFLNRGKEGADYHIENVLSHETLHDVLNRRGEVSASNVMDARHSEFLGRDYYMLPNGMYYYAPKNRRVA